MDLSKLSDDELTAMLQQHAAPDNAPQVDQIKQADDPGQAALQGLTGYAANAMQAIPYVGTAMDEVGSGIAALPKLAQGVDAYKSEYDRNQQAQQLMRQKSWQEQPGANIVGAVGTTLASSRMMPKLPTATSAGQAIVQGARTFMPMGLTAGWGQGDAFASDRDSMQTRATSGLLNGLLSAGIGGAANRIAYGATTPLAQGSKSDILTAQQLAKMYERDKPNINAMGQNDTLLSNAGRGAVGRAEAITTRGGDAADTITNYADARKEQLPSDLSQAISGQFPEGNYPKLLDSITETAKTQAQPAYQHAYDALTSINDPQINQALARVSSAGDWQNLISEAKKLAAYDGNKLPTLEQLANSGKETFSNSSILDAAGRPMQTSTVAPDVSFSTQDLDYMTRALRNLGQGTEGQGALGGYTPLGAARKNAAMSVRGRLGELNPAFGQAAKQYGDSIEMRNAAEAGKAANLMGANWKQSAVDYMELPEPAQQAWRVGQAENLQTQIARNPQAALRQFNSPQFAKALSAFYAPEQLSDLTSELSSKSREMAGLNQVTGNSRTAGRAIQQAEDAAMGSDPLRSGAVDIVRRGPLGAAKQAAGDFLQKTLLNTPTMQQADKNVANVLTSSPFRLAQTESVANTSPVLRNALARMGGGTGLYGLPRTGTDYTPYLLPFYMGNQLTTSTGR